MAQKNRLVSTQDESQRFILDLPRNWSDQARTCFLGGSGVDMRDYNLMKVPCGYLAVELALVHEGIQNQLSGQKMEVSHSIWESLKGWPGIMLPWHMMESLRSEGLKPTLKDGFDLQDIYTTIRVDKKPVIVFLGCGWGHWVTIWGYDRNTPIMFDNRNSVNHDHNGLSQMPTEEFLRHWNKVPTILKVLDRLGVEHTGVRPRTMITW